MKMPYSEAKRSILFWKNVSRILSVAFHPLLLPTILFLLLARYAPITLGQFAGDPSALLLLIFVFTFVIPLALFVVFIFIVYGKFSKERVLLDSRQDRVFPFLLIGIFYCGITYLLYDKLQMPGMIILLIACMSLCILFVGLVSVVWKVSAHATGIVGLIGFLIVIQMSFPDVNLFRPVVFMITTAGFIMSARLYLKAHNLSELFGGCLIGAMTSSLVYVVLNLV